ncbi:hypothetical protein ACFVP3_39250 [Streptomyces sp. NPDC057806]|uniref:hypothetical protein n=1 Tax=Streptomyces sp. NPDC057806 TaxID=3346255 RepID=UPI0036C5BAD9
MTTHVRPPSPLPLPESVVPPGVLPWTGEQGRRWAAELPPRWVPVRAYGRFDELVTVAAGGVTLALAAAGVEPYLAALLPLQLLWVLVRPEVVRVAAPGLVVAAALERAGWAGLLGAVVLAGICLALAEVRLRARKRQRACALAAAEGIAAPVPGAGAPLRRGVLLGVFGPVVIAGGGVAIAFGGMVAAAGFLLVGVGLTLLASAGLGRVRASRLGSGPAPVLRVLVRDDPAALTEVFAADDVAARRPLFAVSVLPLDSGEEEPEDEAEADDAEDTEDEADDDLLDRLADDTPGPLREALLYGVPYDGAEIVIVSADEDPDHPPVVERSVGAVRPVRTVPDAAEEPAEVALVVQPVLRWRAGRLDWLAAVLLAQWGVWLSWAVFTEAGVPLWQQLVVLLVGLYGAARLPVRVGWRITADRAGLWINGLFKVTHIPWDDFRSARHRSMELRLRWRGGQSWTIAAPRWTWLERRRGLTHPYDRLAAELNALHAEPGLRPTGEAEKRGRVLWPWALVLAAAWVAALVTVRAGL